jgi:hypothetical protein
LTAVDLPAAWEMSRLAFGLDHEPPTGWLTERPGRRQWGIFDGGRLVGRQSTASSSTGSEDDRSRRAASRA